MSTVPLMQTTLSPPTQTSPCSECTYTRPLRPKAVPCRTLKDPGAMSSLISHWASAALRLR